MANQDKKQRNESRLTRSLRSNGYLFPTTVEQVKFLEENNPELFKNTPTGITSGEDILARGVVSFAPKRQSLIDEEAQVSLAQAAREGKEIPEDVKRRMRQDRLKSNESGSSHNTES